MILRPDRESRMKAIVTVHYFDRNKCFSKVLLNGGKML